MSEEHILIDRDDKNIVMITVNRPEKLNTLTKTMWGRLGDIFRELSDDDTVRCIMMTGAGGKSFSPGNDISEFEADRSSTAKAAEYGELMGRNIKAMRDCPHPSVAAIRGICVGGGMELAFQINFFAFFFGRRQRRVQSYFYQTRGNEKPREEDTGYHAGDQKRRDGDVGKGTNNDRQNRRWNDRRETGTGKNRADRQLGVVATAAHDRQQRPAEHRTDSDRRAGQSTQHR